MISLYVNPILRYIQDLFSNPLAAFLAVVWVAFCAFIISVAIKLPFRKDL